jgi:S1-C subfamily serine protease
MLGKRSAREIGITVAPTSADDAKMLGMNRPMGVVVTDIRDDSPFVRILDVGEVVLRVNNQVISSEADFYKAMVGAYQSGRLALVVRSANGLEQRSTQFTPKR